MPDPALTRSDVRPGENVGENRYRDVLARRVRVRFVSEGRVALMCAEAVPWRCHRSLIADTLTARGARVGHITGVERLSPHRLTPFARVDGRRVTYPRTEPARAGDATAERGGASGGG